MQGGKKIAIIVVLLAIIAAAVFFIVKKSRMGGAEKPEWAQNALRNKPVEMIDSSTLELITKTHGEWKKLLGKSGKYQNPNTGEYTMVMPIFCAACGEKVPWPEEIEIARPDTPSDLPPSAEEEQRLSDEYEARVKAWLCPRCGGYVAPSGTPTPADIPPPPPGGVR